MEKAKKGCDCECDEEIDAMQSCNGHAIGVMATWKQCKASDTKPNQQTVTPSDTCLVHRRFRAFSYTTSFLMG